MTEQHQGHTEPSSPERQVAREIAEQQEAEKAEEARQAEDATGDGMPESPDGATSSHEGEPGGGYHDAHEHSPDQEGAPGTGDQS